ncbi:hypothetical protein ACWDSJ_26395 [Nocardia sp. NPDC003482]
MPADRSGRPRSRTRSPELVERWERSRQRILEQRAAQREREKAATAAVRAYLAAWHVVRMTEERRDHEIAELRQRITEITSDATTEIRGQEHAQGLAAKTIREQGYSEDEIAEMLELTPKRIRQLLALARETHAPHRERKALENSAETAEKTRASGTGSAHSATAPTQAEPTSKAGAQTGTSR